MGAGVDDAEASFDDWVRPHTTAMRRLAAVLSSADDCDDIVQEALERAWHRRADFDAARGAPRTWLLMLTADRARAQRRRSRPTLVELTDRAAAGTPEADLDLRAAIARLAPRQRQTVRLFYYASLTVAEIATITRISEGTVKSTLHDARRRLAELLEDTDVATR
jgi:RNA polymerase sigma-70 factor (ECF subfamily)